MKRFSFLILLAALACFGCEKKTEIAPPEVVRPIKTITLEAPASGTVRTYPGTIDAGDTADMAFLRPGTVIELPVIRGQKVAKGDLLAKIDPRDFEQAVAAAKAKYVEAQRNAERYKTLFDKGLVATAEMQQKAKDADVLKAELENAEKALQDTVLVAPFDGIISQKLIENFQQVKGGEVVVRVQTVDKLKVSIHMPEQDIANIPPNSRETIKATATFSAVPGREFPLAVAEYETQADPATQTFLVKFFMDQPKDANILPGMTAQVRLVAPSTSPQGPVTFFIVPSAAVFSDEQGKACVWIVDPALLTAHRREVTLRQAVGSGSVQVTGGLAPGEMIAVTGVYQLREGMKVSLIKGKIGE